MKNLYLAKFIKKKKRECANEIRHEWGEITTGTKDI